MDEKRILTTINADLVSNVANRVIYLEGESDPPMFFGLLGVPQPSGGIFLHNQTLVKGFPASSGSGNNAVRTHVQLAQAKGYAGRVFGIVDGDGEELPSLAVQFDPPHAGPLYAWKAYSIESLFGHLAWPTTGWGAAPNWQVELSLYTPYVAINRLKRVIEERLGTLRLDKFRNPITGQALETMVAVEAALQADKGLLSGLDVAAEFGAEAARFQTALGNSVEEAFVLLNGKWLLKHFLVTRLGRSSAYWSSEWVRHAEAVGGLPAVRDLWQRITGSPP